MSDSRWFSIAVGLGNLVVLGFMIAGAIALIRGFVLHSLTNINFSNEPQNKIDEIKRSIKHSYIAGACLLILPLIVMIVFGVADAIMPWNFIH